MGGAIWLVKRVKRREPRILRPNQCAIAHGFGGGLGVQGCHGRKINLDVSGRLGSISVLPICVGEAIWLVKRLKRCKWGILGPNRCAIAHGSKGGPGVENRPERAREAEECPSIACLYGRGHLVGQTGEMAKTGIFYSNRCAIAHGSGSELGVRECRGLKINSGIPEGQIPKVIGSLLNLKVLNLKGNKLVGFIHMSLSNASRLEALEISYNSLQGNIPEWIGNLHNMKVLSIQANQLTGIIPQEIGNLVNLAELAMEINQITGFVPISILNISSLLILSLSMNNFSGFLPREIGNLTKMQNLQLGDNKLIGEIPKEISNLVELEHLGDIYLDQNQLSRSLPNCLGNITSLREIHLCSNKLSSNIPPSLGNLQDLVVLDLSSNHMVGSLPPEIGNLKAATLIDPLMNQFSNGIPTEIGGLKNLENLSFETQQVTRSYT
ncbi:hypothetical protein T459_34075 [Capsicum annuum]|uniref:Disease resistance R13L4/SHOC-2-like LRR domain-containing protein n=1 Tax=Capsicum annuum TaxID=4072 RepID=A0A2G2XXN7_CAPAN|nr:hypothetical protein T459_34075 [Capsicum annuum]